MTSTWDKVKEMLANIDNTHVGANGKTYLNQRSHNLLERHVFNKPFKTIPHAILGCDGKVLAIRSYSRSTKSNVVIPIDEDTGPCAVGYVWNGATFQRPEAPEYV